jgi:hypothetical protein
METGKMIRNLIAGFGIVAMTAMVACEPNRRTADRGSNVNEYVITGNESAQVVEEKIKNLNEEISGVERELMATDRVSEQGFREGWRDIELKRHELNRNIEVYNSAMNRGATLEASEIRADINRLIGELRRDVSSFSSEFGTETEGEFQQQPTDDVEMSPQEDQRDYEIHRDQTPDMQQEQPF